MKDTNGNSSGRQHKPIIGNPGPGHNAWLLTSTALVLFMTLPGLALFYGGLVRRKNVLSVLAQCFLITGLVTILCGGLSATAWSLAARRQTQAFIGGSGNSTIAGC